jgi:hypothetical protein
LKIVGRIVCFTGFLSYQPSASKSQHIRRSRSRGSSEGRRHADTTRTWLFSSVRRRNAYEDPGIDTRTDCQGAAHSIQPGVRRSRLSESELRATSSSSVIWPSIRKSKTFDTMPVWHCPCSVTRPTRRDCANTWWFTATRASLMAAQWLFYSAWPLFISDRRPTFRRPPCATFLVTSPGLLLLVSPESGRGLRIPLTRCDATVWPNRGCYHEKVRVAGAGGSFELIDEPVRDAAAGYARVRVRACDICHSDSVTKEGLPRPLALVRIPSSPPFNPSHNGIIRESRSNGELWQSEPTRILSISTENNLNRGLAGRRKRYSNSHGGIRSVGTSFPLFSPTVAPLVTNVSGCSYQSGNRDLSEEDTGNAR